MPSVSSGNTSEKAKGTFLPCAEHTLASLDAGVASLQKAAQGAGIIRLGILRTLGVDFIPELAAGFLKENPEREIQFTILRLFR